ncbi:MAG: hypothetical protein OXC80_13990 [Gammaproteobacteria bacterium]|nr:hypothetical protein [Gammaproteobacteria bacterium]
MKFFLQVPWGGCAFRTTVQALLCDHPVHSPIKINRRVVDSSCIADLDLNSTQVVDPDFDG